jgi:hypothetical protein
MRHRQLQEGTGLELDQVVFSLGSGQADILTVAGTETGATGTPFTRMRSNYKLCQHGRK